FTEMPALLPRRVAFEADHLVCSSWAMLDEAGVETVPTRQLLEGVRAVKEPGELDTIRRAAAITNECFTRLAEQPFVGQTERDVAWFLESTMHEVCRAAQLAALEAVRPGAVAREVDAVARDAISAKGLGELFGHGLGHGVGAELQEQPWLQPWSDGVLEAGMVTTVEPGIYHPGL